MSKLLLVILSIALAVTAAPSNGMVPLRFTPGTGYTADVDFSRMSAPEKMLISLHSSNTILTQSCLRFATYQCARYTCMKDPFKTAMVNYPTFSAQGSVVISTNVVLDNTYWNLNRQAATLIATACASPVTEMGFGTYGVIGLGYEGGAQYNFNMMGRTFAISYDNAFRTMMLQFNPPQMPMGKSLVSTIRTDANWRVPNVAFMKIATAIELKRPLVGTSMIWDLNSDAIGLPEALFVDLVKGMMNAGLQCNTAMLSQPECMHNGAPLPIISLHIDNFSHVRLTPEMYIKKAGGRMMLNFKALSTTRTGVNFVTQPYANTIILGNTVLGNYNTQFNTMTGSVSLFL